VPRSPLNSAQTPANANKGRSSFSANQTTSFFLVTGLISGAYSAKLLAGTKQRFSGFSHSRGRRSSRRQAGARADELELSRLEIDHLSGLAPAHTSHLISKKFTQIFGPVSLPLMLDTLGLRLLVVEDPELTARTLKRRTPRKSSHLRVTHRPPEQI
jgi:hypothetical protein